jgi:hypothetical protein
LKPWGVELVRGRGYFYFAPLPGKKDHPILHVKETSVYVYHLSDLPIERWVKIAEEKIAEGSARRNPEQQALPLPLELEEEFGADVRPDYLLGINALLDDFAYKTGQGPELIDEVVEILTRNKNIPAIQLILTGTGMILGEGSYGVAAELEDDLVLKVTVDAEELRASAQLKGMQVEHVARIYEAFRVGDIELVHPETGQRGPVGIIIMERLRTSLPPEVKAMASGAVWEVKDDLGPTPRSPDKRRSYLRRSARKLKDKYDSVCQRGRHPANRYACHLANAIGNLMELGIYVTDTHGGNIGLGADGQLKLFDLGVSSSAPDVVAPVLSNPYASGKLPAGTPLPVRLL